MKEWLDRVHGTRSRGNSGDPAGDEKVFGVFEGGHSHETKISAVHFVRFRPTGVHDTGLCGLHRPVSITIASQRLYAKRLQFRAVCGKNGSPIWDIRHEG